MGDNCYAVFKVLIVIAMSYIATESRNVMKRTIPEEHAVLNVSNYTLAVLVDKETVFVTVKNIQTMRCYLINLEESHQTALNIANRVYRYGESSLYNEFTVESEVLQSWIAQYAGSHVAMSFCNHCRSFKLKSLYVSDLPTSTTTPTPASEPINVVG